MLIVYRIFKNSENFMLLINRERINICKGTTTLLMHDAQCKTLENFETMNEEMGTKDENSCVTPNFHLYITTAIYIKFETMDHVVLLFAITLTWLTGCTFTDKCFWNIEFYLLKCNFS